MTPSPSECYPAGIDPVPLQWPDNLGPDDPGPRLVAALRDCLAAHEEGAA